MFTYQIDESTNAVSIFIEGQEPPLIYQPDWPDTTPWADAQQATAWAEQWILARTDETADLAGISPDQPTIPRPSAQE